MALRQGINIANLGGWIFNGTTMTASHEGYAVMYDTAETTTGQGCKYTTAGATVIGIIGDARHYANGDIITLYGAPGQVVDAFAGSAGFAAGDLLKAAAGGGSVTAGSTDPYFAVALDTATTGNMGRIALLGGGSIATNITWTRAATTLYPTTDLDTIATGPTSDLTGLSMVGGTAAGILSAIGANTDVDIVLSPQASGKVRVGASHAAGIPVLTGVVAGVAANTDANGDVTVASMTASAVMFLSGAAANSFPVAAVPTTGKFRAYDANGNAVTSKKLFYFVVSY